MPIIRWKKGKRELLPGLVLFRLVAPPLQPGVVGLYPVRGESPWACLARGPGLAPGRWGRRDDQTGGEILSARTHRKVEKG
jgi:hypothetical protein